MNLEKLSNRIYIYIAALAFVLLIYFIKFLSPNVIINATDILTQDYFWHVFYHRDLRESPSFLTWNPYINSGTPIPGSLFAVFRPLSLLCIFLFPPNLALIVNGILHLFIAGLFTLLFARLVGLRLFSSFLAAIFFVFSTEQISLINAGHIGKLNTVCLFPVVMFALERALQKRRLIDFLFVSFALGLQMYEGHLQISFYTCIAVGIYFIWRSIQIHKTNEDKNETIRIYSYGTIMVLLFFLMSATSFVKMFEFKEQSERSKGTSYEFATSWSMPKKELATYIVPQLFGLSRKNYQDPHEIKQFYWGEMPFTQTSDYLGLLPLILSCIALIKFRSKYVKIFFGLVFLFQLLAFGRHTPVYPIFYEYFGFKFFRVPKMNLFIVSFFVSMLAASGANWFFHDFQEKDRSFLKKFTIVSLAIITLFGLLTLVGDLNTVSLVKHFKSDLSGFGRSFNPNLVFKRYAYAIEGMYVATLFLAISIGLISLRLVPSIKSGLLFVAFFAWFMFDISLINYKFLNVLPMANNGYFSKDTAVQFFEKDDDIFRVLNVVGRKSQLLDYKVPNKYILYKQHSASGYEAVQMTRYNDLMGRMNLANVVADLLNIKYIVLEKDNFPGTLGVKRGKFEVVVEKDIKIIKNHSYLPRVFPVHQALVIKDKNTILNGLTSRGFNPRRLVLLEEEHEGTLPTPTNQSIGSNALISSYENEEIKIDADMADNGFIVLSEKYYPGWKAYVDGVESKIFQANYIFRAIYVPKGKHQITVKYEPKSNKWALYVTILSFISILILLLRELYIFIRKRETK